MKLPERHSLVTQTIEVIQQMIVNGEIVSPLIGERRLSDKLQIGRDTLRTALKELEKQGWISQGLHGKRRSILTIPDDINLPQKQKTVAIVSPKPLELLPNRLLIEFDNLRASLVNKDILLEIVIASVYDTSTPSKRLEKMILEHPADVWVLYRCTPQIQEWFQSREIPCIIRGYPHPGIHLPYLDEDWQAAASHSANQLIQRGHREIALLIPNQSLEGLKAAEKGIRNAINLSTHNVNLHLLTENITKHGVLNALSKGLEAEPNISALIITRPRHLLNTITWLAQHGLKVPEHLSLISLCYEPWFDEVIPAIHYYQTSHTNLARTLSRRLSTLLKGNNLNAHNSLIIPEAIKGQSIKKL